MRHALRRLLAAVALLTFFVPALALAAGPVPGTVTSEPKPTADTFFKFEGAPGQTVAAQKLGPGAKADPRAIVVNIINIVSSFLGIIAVVIILISGFQWMTAGGDEEAVKKAQTRLVQGVIGLVLILSTWSIAFYVVNTLSEKIFGVPGV